MNVGCEDKMKQCAKYKKSLNELQKLFFFLNNFVILGKIKLN